VKLLVLESNLELLLRQLCHWARESRFNRC